jgi:glycosyltransferase involved in cell wall biosynthesis
MSKPASPLHIAMIAPPCIATPPPKYGGTELVVAELIDGLLDLGHRVTLFGAPGSRGGFRRTCAVRAPLGRAVWPPSDAAEALHARLALAEIRASPEPFDVIHGHCPIAVGDLEAAGLPAVTTLHHAREPKYSVRYRRHGLIHYAFISARQRELEVARPLAATVHHGLDPHRYPLGIGDAGHAAFLGRFSACKGLHDAIDAARAAGVPLKAAGRPHAPDGSYFTEQVQPRLDGGGVELVGEADHPAKLALLSGARALLFPISWEEPFGLVMVEAMLCGTPVIAYARGAAPEVVDEGVTGFVVESVDEMAQVLRRLERSGFDRAACRARAIERFGASRMAEDYLALYARAIAAGTGPALGGMWTHG